MFKRLFQIFALCLFGLTMLAADTSATRVDHIGHNLVCQCSCGQILSECNHVGCPVSPVMLDELRVRVADGQASSVIQKFFIAKYGPIVLAAPMRGGFDNVAWIVPIVALLGCMIGIILLMRVWRRRHHAAEQSATQGGLLQSEGFSSLHDRIRSETDYDHWGSGHGGQR